MDDSLTVKLFGFPATLIHGDTLVLDRWNWLRKQLPVTKKNISVLDIGCGSGAFSIGLALMGYKTLGLSWDARNQKKAEIRAEICGASKAKFIIQDVRFLDTREDLKHVFDVIICLETIEHIFNDQKLMHDMAECMKIGGKLLLTSPNYNHIPMGTGDKKEESLSRIEDGRHVRMGYTKEDLKRLCSAAGLEMDIIDYCSGFFSQKITAVMRLINTVHPFAGWALILPLRIFPILLDSIIMKVFKWPGYSICLVAHKK